MVRDRRNAKESPRVKIFGLVNGEDKDTLQKVAKYEDAIIADAITDLVKNGANPKQRDSDGFTLLHHAARRGLNKTCKMLLEMGLDIDDDQNKHRSTPLYESLGAPYELFEQHPQTAELLIKNSANVNKGAISFQPLHRAVINGMADIVDLMIKNHADVNGSKNVPSHGNNTPLHYAAEYRHTKIAQALIVAGADRSALNEKGQTPADVAREKGDNRLARMLEREVHGQHSAKHSVGSGRGRIK